MRSLLVQKRLNSYLQTTRLSMHTMSSKFVAGNGVKHMYLDIPFRTFAVMFVNTNTSRKPQFTHVLKFHKICMFDLISSAEIIQLKKLIDKMSWR